MKQSNLLLPVVFLSVALCGTYCYKVKERQAENTPIVDTRPVVPIERIPEKPKTPRVPSVSVKIPAYLDYQNIIAQCKKWNEEAPDLTEIGVYGKSKRGQDLYYIRICNKLDSKPRPKVLITGCIHGNEPWATGCVMGYIGSLLDGYGSNSEIKELVESRDVYFIPVVSPDSYPHSRHVDGVDPNRDFPGPSRPNHQSTPSIAALQKFFLQIKPSAVISGHTFGRVYLIPYGDTNSKTPHESDYQRIVGKMGQMSNYGLKHCCDIYGRPIHGSEVDWYYRNGAFSIVIEYGTHQQKPSQEEIRSEFDRTFKSVLLFIKDGAAVRQ